MRNWLIVLLAVLALLPALAGAQMYRWVDEQGTVYYTNGLDTVPERYRSEAQPLFYPTAPSAPMTAPAPGTTAISFTPGAPILVSARINGGGPVTLLLDTGADRTMVAPETLSRLGIFPGDGHRAEVRGVTGTAEAKAVQVASLEVGEARAGPLLIIAHDANLPHAEGLLGRDFLANFTVTIDSEEGVVTLAPQ